MRELKYVGAGHEKGEIFPVFSDGTSVLWTFDPDAKGGFICRYFGHVWKPIINLGFVSV